MKHLPKIEVEFINHSQQRYDTAGDYYKDGKKQILKISKMKNLDYEFSVMIHELIEWYLTEKRGIKEKDIMKFDLEHINSDDPGCILSAPYHKEHMFSMMIEKLLMKELDVDWDEYDKSFEDLKYE